ncbi:S-adenosyl-L-methionine-dependent methyltransferase [Patellaria atrata CBS 101060]|uniref:S-adenosyl-L-methionine-dependent methyltransferase n=1 Tax=Patellaria atrata CBS 101060 TaxID=1346257 RepID=A0A9P4VW38_9PEZI|nr:S-adenosyl-L-methionine-dependent methyltransferase [Patellaria atrata CBS 101060]
MSRSMFIPKQLPKITGETLQKLTDNVTNALAGDILPHLPELTSTTIFHDNGCGSGSMTEEVIASDPPTGLKIIATDNNTTLFRHLKSKLAKHGDWPVMASEVDPAELYFPDESIDISYTGFALDNHPDAIGAAKHIWRTLKPGGTAAVAVWTEKPWIKALTKAHYSTRGADAPLPPRLARDQVNDTQLVQNIVRDAAWENVEFIEKEAWIEQDCFCTWSRWAWGYYGEPAGGWTQYDEDRWDDAQDVVVAEMEMGEIEGWFVEEEDVIERVRVKALVAVGQK